MDGRELGKQLCNEKFCRRFLDELEKVFGKHMKCFNKEENSWGFEYVEGSRGWFQAMDRALTAIGKGYLLPDYEKLDWHYSDQVDKRISDYIKENIV